jgi:hypothetical protein
MARYARHTLFDIEDLSGLRSRPHTIEVGVLRRFNVGFLLALDATLFLFLLLLFSRAFADSFFQLNSLPEPTGVAEGDDERASPALII